VFGDLGADNPKALPRLRRDTQQGMYDAILHVGEARAGGGRGGGGGGGGTQWLVWGETGWGDQVCGSSDCPGQKLLLLLLLLQVRLVQNSQFCCNK
jgi:hypothetical protein